MQTITENIINPRWQKAYVGELAVVSVDGIMASVTTAPYAIKVPKGMCGVKL